MTSSFYEYEPVTSQSKRETGDDTSSLGILYANWRQRRNHRSCLPLKMIHNLISVTCSSLPTHIHIHFCVLSCLVLSYLRWWIEMLGSSRVLIYCPPSATACSRQAVPRNTQTARYVKTFLLMFLSCPRLFLIFNIKDWGLMLSLSLSPSLRWRSILRRLCRCFPTSQTRIYSQRYTGIFGNSVCVCLCLFWIIHKKNNIEYEGGDMWPVWLSQ